MSKATAITARKTPTVATVNMSTHGANMTCRSFGATIAPKLLLLAVADEVIE